MKKLLVIISVSFLVVGSSFAGEQLRPEKCYATGASYARTAGKKIATKEVAPTKKAKKTLVVSE